MAGGRLARSGKPTGTRGARQVRPSFLDQGSNNAGGAVLLLMRSTTFALTRHRAFFSMAGGFEHARVWHNLVAEAVRNVAFIVPVYERIAGPTLEPEVRRN